MNLLQLKDCVLHSGQKSDFKIDCDALTDSDIATLAYIITKKIKFKKVFGVPSGGIKLEQALIKYITDDDNLPVLIVDDVLTTGNSMLEYKNNLQKYNNITGVVIFARNTCPDWIKPIFQMQNF